MLGRAHCDATSAVRSMAQAAARRHGAVEARDIERRACKTIGVQLWKRAAKMVEACRPSLDSENAARVLPDAVAQAQARLGRLHSHSNCNSDGSTCHRSRSGSSGSCEDVPCMESTKGSSTGRCCGIRRQLCCVFTYAVFSNMRVPPLEPPGPDLLTRPQIPNGLCS